MPDDLATAWVAIRPDLSGFETELVAGVDADAKAAGTSVPIGADTSGLQAALVGLLAQLQALGATRTDVLLGADGLPLAASLAQAQAELSAFDDETATATLEADISPFLADMAAAQTAMSLVDKDAITVGSDIGAAFAAAGLAAAAESDQGGGDGGGGGLTALLAAMGWGKGMNIPWTGLSMASFGSALSLMGFGAEHVIATGVGIGGSLAGAGIGGGLLGLGMLGTAGVGMGTDMAGIGQAAGDTSTVFSAMTQLLPVTQQLQQAQVAYNNALIDYGANSPQFAAASAQMNSALAAYNASANAASGQQNALNTALQGFSPVAQGAVLAAAEQANAFHMLFNAATGEAEAIGANILNQAMVVGEQFLPTIGKYATQNMGIIQQDLQPLFEWLDSPTGGLGIFTNLEQLFQKELPTAMMGLTNGFELLAKTIDIAAQYGGKFITWISDFVTKMNTVDFGEWSAFVNSMIGDFQTWFGLLVQVGKTIFDIFMPAVGLGQDIARALTGLFAQIDSWLTNPETQDILHGLFAVHLQEVMSALAGVVGGLLPILEGFADGFMRAATIGASLVVPVFQLIAALLDEIDKIPFLTSIIGWVTALALLNRAFGQVQTGILNWARGNAAAVESTAAVDDSFVEMDASAAGSAESFSALSDSVVADSATIAEAFGTTADAIVAGVAEADTALASLDASIAVMRTEMMDAATVGGAGFGIAEDAAGAESIFTRLGGAVSGVGAALAGLINPVTIAVGGFVLLHSTMSTLVQDVDGINTSIDLQIQGQDKWAIATGKSATNIAQLTGASATFQTQMSAVKSLMDQTTNSGTGLAGAFDHLPSAFGVSIPTTTQLAGQLKNLNSAYQEGQAAISTYNTNVGELATQFGLTKQQVEVLAVSLGINLTQALNPTAFNQFAQTVQSDMTQTGGVAGQVASIIATAMKTMAIDATTAAQNTHLGITSALSPLVTDLLSIGQNSTAGFIQKYLDAETEAGDASKNIHDSVFNPLAALIPQLASEGNLAALGLVAQFVAAEGPAATSAKIIHDGIFSTLAPLIGELNNTGNSSADGLVNAVIEHEAAAATAGMTLHDAITGQLQPLISGLESIGDQSGANLIAGLALHEAGWNAEANKLYTDAYDALSPLPAALQALGASAGAGFGAGLASQEAYVASETAKLVSAAITTAHQTLQNPPFPSFVFQELGQSAGHGFAVGLSSMLASVSAAAGALVAAAISSAGGGVLGPSLGWGGTATPYPSAASGVVTPPNVTFNQPITINGTGLSQAALTQAVSAALEQQNQKALLQLAAMGRRG